MCLLRELKSFQRGLWVSVGQLAAKLQPVKVGALKKILLRGLSQVRVARGWLSGRILSKAPTLTGCNFEAS